VCIGLQSNQILRLRPHKHFLGLICKTTRSPDSPIFRFHLVHHRALGLPCAQRVATILHSLYQRTARITERWWEELAQSGYLKDELNHGEVTLWRLWGRQEVCRIDRIRRSSHDHKSQQLHSRGRRTWTFQRALGFRLRLHRRRNALLGVEAKPWLITWTDQGRNSRAWPSSHQSGASPWV